MNKNNIRRLKAEGAKLSARLSPTTYPEPVRAIAGSIVAGIDAAQIGMRAHPQTIAKILEDVAALETMLGIVRQA